MTRSATATLAAALCLSAGFALPAPASADEVPTGGTAAPEPGARGDGAPGGSGPLAGSPAASGGLRAARGALLGRRQRVSGAMSGVGSGATVLLQRSDASGWVTVATARTRDDGAFTATWRADRTGRVTLRAVADDGSAARASRAAPTVETVVYRASIATHFGGGFYGSRTACGTVLTRQTIGVAHKTLPCGTVLEFYYRGRTVRAPVVDRGPYANNAAWDLTMAASRALGFNGKDYVGAIKVGRVSLRRAR
jgi:hypothetical protein